MAECLRTDAGRELFYWEVEDGFSGSSRTMIAVNDTIPTFNPGTPRLLFEGVYLTDFHVARTWDITPDGQRFLMIKDDEGTPETLAAEGKLILVQNWFEELKRLVPVD